MNLGVEELAKNLRIDIKKGLSCDDLEERVTQFGSNNMNWNNPREPTNY